MEYKMSLGFKVEKRALLLITFLIVLSSSVFNVDFLPLKYFFDSNTILSFIYDIKIFNLELRFFDSYYNTAVFYHIFFPNSYENPPSAILRVSSGLLSWVPFFLSFIIYSKDKVFIKLIPSIVFLMGSVIISIYCAQRTKEVVAIWFSFLSFYSLNKGYFKTAIIIVLFYSLMFRGYWILSIYLLGVFSFLESKFFSKANSSKIALFLVSYFFISVLYNFFTGEFITDHRFSINESRLGEINNTVVNNLIFNSNIITDFFNLIFSALRFILPLELVFLGGIKYIIFFMFWFLIVYEFTRHKKKIADLNSHTFYLGLSLFLVLSIFEPDFGSFVKHSIILLPGFFIYLSNKRRLIR